MATITSQVSDPSVAGVLFQCRAFIERIGDGFPPSEYPSEARRILQVFEILVRRIELRLLAIQEQRGRHAQTRECLPLAELAAQQTNHLAHSLRELYSCLRFLHASDPQSTPPEIQTAVSRLVREFVIPALGCPVEEVVVLVRPRWTAPNFVDLIGHLDSFIEVADLDPGGETGAVDLGPSGETGAALLALINHDWKSCRFDGSPPRRVAVISFAGSDAHDALLYPLLAHEIGHFLSVAFGGSGNVLSPLAASNRVISTQEVADLFDLAYPPLSPLVAQDAYRQERVGELCNHANDLVDICLREIVADLLATRMLGVAYFIPAAEYLKTVSSWPEEFVTESGYPGIACRLRLMLQELTSDEAGIGAIRRLEAVPAIEGSSVQAALRRTIDYLKTWGARLEPPLGQPGARFTLFAERLCSLAQQRVEAVLPQLLQFVRVAIPTERLQQIRDDLGGLVSQLENRVAPAQPLLSLGTLSRGPEDARFSDVLLAGWVYELAIGERLEEEAETPEGAFREYQNTCQLLFKAIELQEARAEVQYLDPPGDSPARENVATGGNAGVASGPRVLELLLRDGKSGRLVVVPYYGTSPVNTASLDLRLGNWFRIARRTRSTEIDLSSKDARTRIRREAQQEEYVRFGDSFALHPGDFALGVSLEYFSIPHDLMAFVEGKSSLGRTGLIVATATQVAPGFKGGIVLELFNSGTVPLLLRPGMSIAQLVFVHTDRAMPPSWLYGGRFRCQVKP